MARQPQAGLDHRAASSQPWVDAGVRGHHVEPDDLPEGDRAGRPTTTSSSASSIGGGAVGRRRVLGPRHAPTSRTRSRILRPVYDESDGVDGFVSVEVAPASPATPPAPIAAARELHERDRRAQPVREDPGTAEGVAGDPADDRRGPQHQRHPVFSLDRYAEVIEAYLAGLEAARGRPQPRVVSVASFFVSRVDTEVDRRLEAIGTDEALGPAGQGRGRPGPARLPAVPRALRGPALGGAGGPGRAGAAAAVGVDVDQEPGLPRHALRRHPHRARHGQHAARGHARGVRRPRHPGPHGRRRPRRRPRRRSTRSPRSASTSTTSPRRSRSEGVAAFAKSFDELLGALEAQGRPSSADGAG